MAKQTKRKQGGKGRPFDRDGGVQAARRAPGAQRGPDAVAPLRQLVGLKSTDQPATTPDPDPYLDPLDGYKPAEWHIPRAVASRFGLPVRFPALWPDEPLGTSLSNLRPAELWEALFATLWRLAKQKDQKWTKRMEHEMDYRLFKAGKNLGGLVEDLLALKRVPTGRPPGSGGIARLGNSLPLLRQFLLFEIGKGRTRERGYTPTTMTNLEYWWEEWRDIKDFPVRDFPKAHEALRLKWADIDFEESTITVVQSKTAAGRRILPMTIFVKSELQKWRDVTNGISEYVFSTGNSPVRTFAV